MQINTTSDALDNLNKKLGGADIEIEPSTNKVDALKKIYKTLGGTDDVSGLSTVYQVIEKITEVAEAGGGGGDSDFSTANLNIKNEADNIYSFLAAFCYDEYGDSAGEIVVLPTSETTVLIILYKGKAEGHFLNTLGTETFTITGDIVEDVEEDGIYYITGDCTITISTPK